MTSGVVASHIRVNGSTLSDMQSREISDYEKIIRLHDEILAGTHPRLKIPAQIAGKLPSRSVQTSAPISPRPAAANVKPPPVVTTHPKSNNERPNKASGGNTDVQSTSLSKSTSTRIDPVLLTKSDELVRAEIRLKRERIEKALREQLERNRNDSGQTVSYQEIVPEIDVSEVLAKALADLRPATATVAPTSTNNTDSVDEKSFYSSKHDESSSGGGNDALDEHQSEQATKKAEDRNERSTSVIRPIPYEANVTEDLQPDLTRDYDPSSIRQGSRSLRNDLVNEEHSGRSQAIRYRNEPQVRSEVLENSEGGREMINTTSARLEYNLNAFNRNASYIGLRGRQPEEQLRGPKDESPPRGPAQEPFREAIRTSRPSPDVPVIRSTIRSPVAPQPARVSPLAVARLPAAGLDVRDRGEAIPRPLSSGQSPGSPNQHPQILHPPKRRRVAETNERSRKAPLRRIARSPELLIKQEPNSPPPFVFSESQLQQRHRQVELDREPDRHDALGVYTNVPDERLARHEEGTPSTARFSSIFPRDTYDRSHKHRADFHRYASIQLPREPRSPPSYPVYSPSGSRPVRAVSHTYYERPAPEIIHYYRDDVGPYRSQYIHSDRSHTPPPLQEMISPSHRRPVVMAPPGHAPVHRVTVDENGRYLEAPPATYVRQSMVPASGHTMVSSTRPRETGPYYEHIQVPVRVSDDSYPEHRYVERSAASPIMRRMTAQPDENGFRPYRHREYSTHPGEVVVPREQYMYARDIRDRGPRDQYDEVVVPRNYIQRLPSVRPEDIRYRVSPQERVSRLQGSHGEPGNRAYSTSGRFEAIPQPLRDYSVRPEEEMRGYIPAQTERYTYLPEQSGHRYVDEIRYM